MNFGVLLLNASVGIKQYWYNNVKKVNLNIPPMKANFDIASVRTFPVTKLYKHAEILSKGTQYIVAGTDDTADYAWVQTYSGGMIIQTVDELKSDASLGQFRALSVLNQTYYLKQFVDKTELRRKNLTDDSDVLVQTFEPGYSTILRAHNGIYYIYGDNKPVKAYYPRTNSIVDVLGLNVEVANAKMTMANGYSTLVFTPQNDNKIQLYHLYGNYNVILTLPENITISNPLTEPYNKGIGGKYYYITDDEKYIVEVDTVNNKAKLIKIPDYAKGFKGFVSVSSGYYFLSLPSDPTRSENVRLWVSGSEKFYLQPALGLTELSTDVGAQVDASHVFGRNTALFFTEDQLIEVIYETPGFKPASLFADIKWTNHKKAFLYDPLFKIHQTKVLEFKKKILYKNTTNKQLEGIVNRIKEANLAFADIQTAKIKSLIAQVFGHKELSIGAQFQGNGWYPIDLHTKIQKINIETTKGLNARVAWLRKKDIQLNDSIFVLKNRAKQYDLKHWVVTKHEKNVILNDSLFKYHASHSVPIRDAVFSQLIYPFKKAPIILGNREKEAELSTAIFYKNKTKPYLIENLLEKYGQKDVFYVSAPIKNINKPKTIGLNASVDFGKTIQIDNKLKVINEKHEIALKQPGFTFTKHIELNDGVFHIKATKELQLLKKLKVLNLNKLAVLKDWILVKHKRQYALNRATLFVHMYKHVPLKKWILVKMRKSGLGIDNVLLYKGTKRITMIKTWVARAIVPAEPIETPDVLATTQARKLTGIKPYVPVIYGKLRFVREGSDSYLGSFKYKRDDKFTIKKLDIPEGYELKEKRVFLVPDGVLSPSFDLFSKSYSGNEDIDFEAVEITKWLEKQRYSDLVLVDDIQQNPEKYVIVPHTFDFAKDDINKYIKTYNTQLKKVDEDTYELPWKRANIYAVFYAEPKVEHPYNSQPIVVNSIDELEEISGPVVPWNEAAYAAKLAFEQPNVDQVLIYNLTEELYDYQIDMISKIPEVLDVVVLKHAIDEILVEAIKRRLGNKLALLGFGQSDIQFHDKSDLIDIISEITSVFKDSRIRLTGTTGVYIKYKGKELLVPGYFANAIIAGAEYAIANSDNKHFETKAYNISNIVGVKNEINGQNIDYKTMQQLNEYNLNFIVKSVLSSDKFNYFNDKPLDTTQFETGTVARETFMVTYEMMNVSKQYKGTDIANVEVIQDTVFGLLETMKRIYGIITDYKIYDVSMNNGIVNIEIEFTPKNSLKSTGLWIS
jgi:hypothetical protein